MDYIQGIIKYITFYNEENHYGIIKIEATESSFSNTLFDLKDLVTITGYFPRFSKGDHIRFYGEKTMHPTYGEQFNATSYERFSDISLEGLIDYLSSDLFKGVGEKTAINIVETLGKDAIKKIIEDKSCLDKVPKLSNQVKESLHQGLIEHKANEQTLIRLYGYGISSKMALKMMRFYKERTMQVLEENPYKMIDDIEGVGFERADYIAQKLGFTKDHPLRIKAMILYLLKYIIYQQGHTIIPKTSFIELAYSKLSNQDEAISHDHILKHINALIKEGKVVELDDYYTTRTIFNAESEITLKLKTLSSQQNPVNQDKVNQLISAFELKEDIKYDSLQKKAIIDALKNRVMILTGGPGTGKTTVIKGLIDVYYRYYGLKQPSFSERSLIHLIAPTGKAAKRMQESTSAYAETIHRFLGYSFDGTFLHDKYHLVEGNLFIIDEASMIDVFLAAQLLQSLPDYAHVILVGDDAQLPSVGPGEFLKDLIESKQIHTIKLNYIHRQKQDSSIIAFANAIREGILPSDALKNTTDRFMIKESQNAFKSRLKSIIDYFIKEGYDLHKDIQVLIPMYKGLVGIDETNQFLQTTYNPLHEGIMHFNKTFKVNDKILQLTNQIEDGVMNGDQGLIVSVDQEKKTVTARFDETIVEYNYKDLNNITHAYAMSIHKAQGSEYKIVIVPFYKAHTIMLKRKLIYTAITRAKEKLIMLGDLDRLAYSVNHLEESRLTRLKSLLMDIGNEINETLSDEVVVHKIQDPTIPFDTLGEDLNGLTPYDFLDKS
ncbi:MAG: ATP-dependent RecD-like DNA helicase [Candidatus Izemoplasmataceae bacterium]